MLYRLKCVISYLLFFLDLLSVYNKSFPLLFPDPNLKLIYYQKLSPLPLLAIHCSQRHKTLWVRRPFWILGLWPFDVLRRFSCLCESQMSRVARADPPTRAFEPHYITWGSNWNKTETICILKKNHLHLPGFSLGISRLPGSSPSTSRTPPPGVSNGLHHLYLYAVLSYPLSTPSLSLHPSSSIIVQ